METQVVQCLNHYVNRNGICSMTSTDADAWYPKESSTVSGASDTLVIDATHEHTSVRGGKEHNNLQPYITCYMWKRTE